ncbi:MAG: UvrB/UvrC motif-containing protein [Clostridiales bacterium]|jgi:protein arginine kinase activator|nr:UvrB/UvrC motif-containing protein [Clostridiales bacterium]
MLCQKCNEKQATVHFVKVVNGVKAEMHLCEKCAPQQELPAADNFDIAVSDIINSLFGGSAAAAHTKCGRCGTTLRGFSQTGKLGCSDCYDAFGKQLEAPLKRIHGGTRHAGKTPKRAGGGGDKLTHLKKSLEAAIAKEDFENAAVIRDEIRALEGGSGK